MTRPVRIVISINVSEINLSFTRRSLTTNVFFKKPNYIWYTRDTHKQNDSKKSKMKE